MSTESSKQTTTTGRRVGVARVAPGTLLVIFLVAVLVVCGSIARDYLTSTPGQEREGSVQVGQITEAQASVDGNESRTNTGAQSSSTDVAGSSAESLERSYEKLLDESEHLRDLLEESGSHGSGGTISGLQWPVAGSPVVSSPFGPRTHPVLDKEIMHEGIDIAVVTSTPVEAAAGGTVLYAGDLDEHGKTLIVDHGDGLATVYCHLSRVFTEEGVWVEEGGLIAESGNTGLTTGPHLHFEVRINGVPVDPAEFLPNLSATIGAGAPWEAGPLICG